MLGCLLGTAIGDALGAPVEMWARQEIRAAYGHIDGLLPLKRDASPEGPWGDDLPGGSSTDDTRWKAIFIEFLTGADPGHPRSWPTELSPESFCQLICRKHAEAALRPEPERLWLKEWDRVAWAYLNRDQGAYRLALSRFYGGAMTCAGMLYAPVIGAAYPGAPTQAYRQAHRLSLFDQGYAQDLSALVAAMTSAALQIDASPETMLAVIDEIDPFDYGSSRLIGRRACHGYQLTRDLAQQADGDWEQAYQLLDAHQQDFPFHPYEIWLVLLTACQVCGFQFRPTLAFIVNYGRDNDTTAAIAGAILGALHGATSLPDDLVEPTMEAHLSLNLDLAELTWRMVYRGEVM